MSRRRLERPERTCDRCGARIRRYSTTGLCVRCATKDRWADPETRERIMAGLRSQRPRKARTYEELTWDDFHRLGTGRYLATCEAGRRIFRARWVWERAHGPIPAGMVIHHVNRDCGDDRLENLQMLTRREHDALHAGDKKKEVDATCQHCGVTFRLARADRPQSFCSQACYRAHRFGKPKDQYERMNDGATTAGEAAGLHPR